MGHIRSFDEALDFYPDSKPGLGARLVAALRTVATVWEALREGHAASTHYHHLRARGLSHEAAATRVFGFR
ncbi:MAG: hypothetical protein NW223_11945 [Hyphomicrobiaceae bacterium]|nr:hypothetical protein [Hyphomicrobiaceae bacterium]